MKCFFDLVYNGDESENDIELDDDGVLLGEGCWFFFNMGLWNGG